MVMGGRRSEADCGRRSNWVYAGIAILKKSAIDQQFACHIAQRLRAIIGHANGFAEDITISLFPDTNEEVEGHVGLKHGLVPLLEARAAVRPIDAY